MADERLLMLLAFLFQVNAASAVQHQDDGECRCDKYVALENAAFQELAVEAERLVLGIRLGACNLVAVLAEFRKANPCLR